MPLKIKPIRFNLKDRGYKVFGNNRNFNVPMLVASINSEATQERVKGRNMFGFYGHWPRIKFGHLTSVEGGLENGQPSIVEPALVTTSLKALPDGTIEHETEFLDTEAGRAAARLNQSRAGGFSSVIDNVKNLFIGLDYVLEPNFRANRGYTLDSAGAALTFDDACGLDLTDIDANIRDEQLHALHILMDSAEQREKSAIDLISRLEQEKEELLSLLAKRDPSQAATFDSAVFQARRLVMVDRQGASDFLQKAKSFDSAQVAEYAADDSQTAPPKPKLSPQVQRAREVLLSTSKGATYG